MKKNIIFLVYQTLIWGTIMGISFMPQILNEKNNILGYEKWQLILDFVVYVCFLVGVSFGLKLAFNKYIDLINFRLWEIFKIFLMFIVSALFFYALLMSYNYIMLNYVYLRPEVLDHPSQNFKVQILFVIIFCFLFFIWTIFYTIIKSTNLLKENLVEKAQLESTLKESQLNALKGQINPHFMFNSLNNIRGLILENPEKARELITQLSEMLRYSLTKNDVNAISIEEELEIVENYISISKIQLEERLQFQKEIQTNTLKMQIPPMIIQLLIENGVKHGIANLKNGGIIKLIIKTLNDNLIIEVINSGKLTFTEDTTQMGLKNIKERIALLYGKKATFSLEQFDENVIAKINLPLSK